MLFKAYRGTESNLPHSHHAGYVYFTIDKGNLYVDISSDTADTPGIRMRVNAGRADSTASCDTALQLVNSRNIHVNLENDEPASFDGTADAIPGVSGILPLSHGGIGINNLITNAILLGNEANPIKQIVSADGAFYSTGANAEPQFGILPIAQGGTGNSIGEAQSAISLSTGRNITADFSINSSNAGLFNGTQNILIEITGICPVSKGGTGRNLLDTNAVLLGDQANMIKMINTANGAFYATSANGIPQFGVLPVAQGGTGNTTGESPSAIKLATAKDIQTNLSSTSAASFDGTISITPGVIGTLSIANGGTGATIASTALSNLGGFPKTGGTITGATTINANFSVTGNHQVNLETNLIHLGTGNYGCKVNFGDGNYVYLQETPDDILTIHSHRKLSFTAGIDNQGDSTILPSDHPLPVEWGGTGNTTGAMASSSAQKLAEARTIALTGDMTGSTSFDGSANVNISTTLSNTGVNSGEYGLLGDDLRLVSSTDSGNALARITLTAKQSCFLRFYYKFCGYVNSSFKVTTVIGGTTTTNVDETITTHDETKEGMTGINLNARDTIQIVYSGSSFVKGRHRAELFDFQYRASSSSGLYGLPVNEIYNFFTVDQGPNGGFYPGLTFNYHQVDNKGRILQDENIGLPFSYDANKISKKHPLPVSLGGTESTDVGTARTKLDVYSKAEVDAKIGNGGSSNGSSGNTVTSADKLTYARTIQTDLSSASAVAFNGTKNITPGITGTLSISHGGTGATTIEGTRDALYILSKDECNCLVPSVYNGTIPVNVWGKDTMENKYRASIELSTQLHSGNGEAVPLIIRSRDGDASKKQLWNQISSAVYVFSSNYIYFYMGTDPRDYAMDLNFQIIYWGKEHFQKGMLPGYNDRHRVSCILIKEDLSYLYQNFDPFSYSASTVLSKSAQWWSDLQQWVIRSSVADRQKMLGRVYKVTLTSSVLGVADHFVRCIGYDCDGNQTLTFQTMNSLADNSTFSSSSTPIWYDGTTNSIARANCIKYYNAFPGKNSIKTVRKKYCSLSNGSNQSSDKQWDETCFLPSYAEMGYTTKWASAMDEFAVENTDKIPYQYYSSDAKRKKFEGGSQNPEGSTSTGKGYWTRSRQISNSSQICAVSSDGSYNSVTYNSNYKIAPAFVIG